VRPLIIISFLILLIGCKKPVSKPLNNFITVCGYGNSNAQYYGDEIDKSLFISGQITNQTKDILWANYSLTGEKIFEKSIDLGSDEIGIMFKQSSNGLAALIGNQLKNNLTSNGFLLLIDLKGNIISKTLIGEGFNTRVSDLLEISTNRFLILGEATKFGSSNKQIFIAEIDLNNQNKIIKTLNISKDKNLYLEGGTSLAQNLKGEIFVFGYTQSKIDGDRDLTFGKLNLNYEFEFDTIYQVKDYQEGQKMIALPNGNFCLAGHTAETDVLHNIFAMEINENGNHIWKEQYGGELHEGAEDLILGKNGNLFIAARTNSFGLDKQKAILIECTSKGKMIHYLTFDNHPNIYINNIIETELNTYLIGKVMTGLNENEDFIMINASNF